MDLREVKERVAGISSRDLLTVIMQRKAEIEDMHTYMLCDELEMRDGVEAIHINPYEIAEVPSIEGPATVFVVTD